MKLRKPFSIQFIHVTTLMLVVFWLVSGCSGSGNSVANGEQPPISSTTPEANNSDDNGISNENIDAAEAEPDTEITSTEMTLEDEANEAGNSNPVVVDPMIQNRIPVTFEINVPFYISDELRVELIWGEINLTAMWVGGQFWSAAGEFPTETEHLLTITFYDKNGAVELARYSQEYRVGSNASESVQITAEQFDANQFDDDSDRVNNLAELNAGTDPFVDEDSLLEISDAFALNNSGSQYSRISASQHFESFVQQDRPYVDTYETEGRVGDENGYYYKTLYGKFNINIDVDGNGTLEVNTDEPRRYLFPTLSAIRTNSGSSISWAGEYRIYDGDYNYSENIINTVSVVDDNLRNFVQEVTGSNNGTFRFSWKTSANLTGRLIEGSSRCEPVSGTFIETRQSSSSYPPNLIVVTTVTKEIDDPYWRIVEELDGLKTNEYFARNLEILRDYRDYDDEESAFFTCDFVDF